MTSKSFHEIQIIIGMPPIAFVSQAFLGLAFFFYSTSTILYSWTLDK